MKLFHYTTIETLALILAKKTIRFSRLDQLDDFREVEIYQSDYTKNTFVSCWCKNEGGLESIPQWGLYGGNKKGVLIGLSQSSINIPSPAEIRAIDGVRYVIMGNMITDNKPFPIEYHELDSLRELARKKEVINEVDGVKIYGQFGNYKSKDWEFQKEYRYAINVIKWNGDMDRDKSFLSQIKPDITYFDVALKDGFESDLEVTLGPLCDESHKTIVEELFLKYKIEKTIGISNLKGAIRK